jgi:hypothetical protein
MRGRKGKYYSQVDDEDQTFLEQERRLIDGKGGDEYGEEDDDRRLDAIEEESMNSTQRKFGDDDTKLLNKKDGKLGNSKDTKTSPKGANLTSPRELKQLEEKILKEQTSPHGASGKFKNLAQDPQRKAILEEAEEHEDEHIPGGKKGAKKGPRGSGGEKSSSPQKK